MTNPDREELVKLNDAGLEAAVRECARITAPEISDDEYERIKADNSPRYQNTRTEMARAIRAYLRAAKPALSSIVTCCVTGAIPGDGGACGDCDPCLLGETSVPSPVKRLIAEKNSLLHRIGELEDKLAEALTAPGAMTKSDGGAKAGSSPILASKEEKRTGAHGVMPVGTIADAAGCTDAGPSDTRPADVTVTPRVIDNDRDEIVVTLNGNELRGWGYSTEHERRVKMLCAREFVEGFHAGRQP